MLGHVTEIFKTIFMAKIAKEKLHGKNGIAKKIKKKGFNVIPPLLFLH
jgi:hypothetical protein